VRHEQRQSYVRRPWRAWSRATASDGETEGGRVRARKRAEGVNEEMGSAASLPNREMEQQQGAAMVGAHSLHG
jgi:hypothetical protein